MKTFEAPFWKQCKFDKKNHAQKYTGAGDFYAGNRWETWGASNIPGTFFLHSGYLPGHGVDVPWPWSCAWGLAAALGGRGAALASRAGAVCVCVQLPALSVTLLTLPPDLRSEQIKI